MVHRAYNLEENRASHTTTQSVILMLSSSAGFRKLAIASSVFVFGTLIGLTVLSSNHAPTPMIQLERSISPMNSPVRRSTPYVFIGGHESSGTGLMRIKLDAHPWIRCGAEPMITNDVLHLWNRYANPPGKRALEAGIYPDAINNATRAYIQEVIEHMGPDAKVLCHKQPTSFQYLSLLAKLFPTAKFIHMVRDGRGVVTSSISRHLMGQSQPQQSLESWQRFVTTILSACAELGPARCMNVQYETLILHTERELRRVLDFIGVPWDPIILYHETLVDQLTNLNKYEPSTKQFLRAVHNESLLAWAQPMSPIPKEVLEKSCETIPLLKQLKYCPDTGYLPNYAQLPPTMKYP